MKSSILTAAVVAILGAGTAVHAGNPNGSTKTSIYTQGSFKTQTRIRPTQSHFHGQTSMKLRPRAFTQTSKFQQDSHFHQGSTCTQGSKLNHSQSFPHSPTSKFNQSSKFNYSQRSMQNFSQTSKKYNGGNRMSSHRLYW